MKNIIIISILLFLSINTIFSLTVDEISDYSLEIIAKIEYGKQEGKLGIRVIDVRPGGKLNPGPMAWRENGEVYIIDANNKRINIYDENFKYLKKIGFWSLRKIASKTYKLCTNANTMGI